VERIRYLLTTYLRLRRKKIEKYAQYLLNNLSEKLKMNQEEKEYCEKYLNIEQGHYKKIFGTVLGEGFWRGDGKNVLERRPEIDQYVICKIGKQDVTVDISQTTYGLFVFFHGFIFS